MNRAWWRTLVVAAILLLWTGPAMAMYHPTVGRWLQRDPGRRADGPSLYQYVRSAPPRYVDSSGLYGDETHQAETVSVGESLMLSESGDIANADLGADDLVHNAATQGVVSVLTFGLFGQDYQLHFPGARQPDFLYVIFGDHSERNYVYPGFLNDVVVRWVFEAIRDCDAERAGRALHALQDSYSHEGWPERGFHPEFFDPHVGAIANPAEPRVNWQWLEHPLVFRDAESLEPRIGIHETINAGGNHRQLLMARNVPRWRRRVPRIPQGAAGGSVDTPGNDGPRWQKAMADTRIVLAEYRRHCCVQLQPNGQWTPAGPQP